MTTTLAHSGGQWMRSEMACRPMKQDAQGMGSVITYLRRYSLASMVGVAPDDDDDGNAASNQMAPARAQTQRQPDRAPPPSSNPFSPPPGGNSHHIPVPVDCEGSGSDWREWATMIRQRLAACSSSEDIQAVLDANRDSLDTLRTVSAKGYSAVKAVWDAGFSALAGG